MTSANIRNLGTTGTLAPNMKRAVAQLSDGSAVMIVPDNNTTATGGDDVTGTAKIHFYKSDSTRSTWSLNLSYTPSPAASSTTKIGVLSVTAGTDDTLHLVYQGTDNSLNYVPFTLSGGNYSAGTKQTVVAANAVTNRYRAVDIDIAGTTNPAIVVCESKQIASPTSGWLRVYIRNNDGTTWRKAYELDFASEAGGTMDIYGGSEDVSLSWNYSGISSNVGQLIVGHTNVAAAWDHGTQIFEISYNVSTGTDGSATVVGTWPKFYQDVAAGTRKVWIFKTSANL